MENKSTYSETYFPNHPKARHNGAVRDHILVCEQVLGKPLPEGAVPHHVDGNKRNNKKSNLVICQDQSYHALLHVRLKALRESGDPNKRKCKFCKQYDFPQNLFITKERSAYHKKCKNEYNKNWRQKRKTLQR